MAHVKLEEIHISMALQLDESTPIEVWTHLHHASDLILIRLAEYRGPAGPIKFVHSVLEMHDYASEVLREDYGQPASCGLPSTESEPLVIPVFPIGRGMTATHTPGAPTLP